MKFAASLTFFFLASLSSFAHAAGPEVLVVVAHPDDEYCFAATLYRITHELGGHVVQVVVSNGEGGFRYSNAAQVLYGAPFANAAEARAKLPAIREQELKDAGKILGVDEHIFLHQPDFGNVKDLNDSLTRWDRALIDAKLAEVLASRKFDLVLTLLPTEVQHGQHKSTAIFALEAVQKLPEAERPAVFGCWNDTYKATLDENTEQNLEIPAAKSFEVLNWVNPATHQSEPYNITRVAKSAPVLQVDRTLHWGFRYKLTYQLPVNWMIAEHKSQGLFQTYFYRDDLENLSSFQVNTAASVSRATELLAPILSGSARPCPQVVDGAPSTQDPVWMNGAIPGSGDVPACRMSAIAQPAIR